MMRILVRRMAEAAVQFVSPPQTGFVPDAFIGENIMFLKLIQSYLEKEDEDADFLFLDMEKAFDRCSWDFLLKALEKVGFDDDFISYIKLAYSQDNAPERQLYTNGYLGPKFNIRSGVAQGCPLSPLLFLLITEPLTRLIMQSPESEIKGIKINATRYIISQYADDTTLLLAPGDQPAVNRILKVWELATGMKENIDKREGQLLAKLNRERNRAPTDVVREWLADGETIRALGAPMRNSFPNSCK